MDRPSSAIPSLSDVPGLIQEELTTAQEGDEILECGRPALALLPHDPVSALEFAYQKLHDVPYKEVKTCWRRLYTDAALWKAASIIEQGAGAEENWMEQAVKTLDMALILTGGPGREDLIETIFKELERELEKPSKKRKRDDIRDHFATELRNAPDLRFPIARTEALSLEAFQTRVSKTETQMPLVITHAIDHWPALTSRPWNNPSYLLQKTLNGHRLVPIELGRTYTEASWTQKITPFRTFVEQYILAPSPTTGYLAQHDLLTQIPSLRADIAVPDYCYVDPAPHRLPHIKPVPQLDEPLLNAWFGPKGTISPLHTDPYHNILAQVVGYKYIRLYAPAETGRLYPRGVDVNGIDMHNTSQVDLDVAMGMFPVLNPFKSGDGGEEKSGDGQARCEFEEQFPDFKDAGYVECVLGPGECLYVPVGWWHYVRSLSPSFSVSFWFN